MPLNDLLRRLPPVSVAVISAMLLFAGLAEADPGRHSKFKPAARHHAAPVEYARVVAVEPLLETVAVQVPVRECYESYASSGGRHRSTVVPTVAGGVIGGLIGDRFGGGSGRDAMRLLGVLVGASVGHDAAVRHQPQYESAAVYPVTDCTTRYESRYEERVIGYHVTYRHHGRTYATRTDRHPGDRIPVAVDVRPAW